MQFSFLHITRARIASWLLMDRREIMLFILAALFATLILGIAWDAYIFYAHTRNQQNAPESAASRPAPFSFAERDINESIRLIQEREAQLQQLLKKK